METAEEARRKLEEQLLETVRQRGGAVPGAAAEAARLELEQKVRDVAWRVPGDDEPPRVCFGQITPVANPVQTRNEMRIACGRTLRRQDYTTGDRDLVTCPLCKEVLAGLQAVGATPPPTPPTQPLTAGKSWHAGYRTLLDAMNVEQLEAKKADLEGELAAVGVLLDAARARQKKIPEGAGG